MLGDFLTKNDSCKTIVQSILTKPHCTTTGWLGPSNWQSIYNHGQMEQ